MIIARRWVAQCLQNYRNECNTVRGTEQSGAHSKKFSLHSSWRYVAVADSCERDDLKVEIIKERSAVYSRWISRGGQEIVLSSEDCQQAAKEDRPKEERDPNINRFSFGMP
jgi:hypothetical protein